MPLIKLESLGYRYPEADRPVFTDITTEVVAGEVILLRGPSGGGKSTLLRCLNGLVPHSSGGALTGRVKVCGLDTREHPPREMGAQVGFVFQHPEAQFVLDDVEAELAFGLENLGLPRSLMRKRIEEVLDQVGINSLRRRRIATLSGGERQRVAIATALVMHPRALVLDEPTSQLDPQAAEDVLQVVLRLVAELGMTTIIAEHRVERIAPFVDRVWTLDGGQLRDQAPREALVQAAPAGRRSRAASRLDAGPPQSARGARSNALPACSHSDQADARWRGRGGLSGRCCRLLLRRGSCAAGGVTRTAARSGERADGSQRIREDHAAESDCRLAPSTTGDGSAVGSRRLCATGGRCAALCRNRRRGIARSTGCHNRTIS
jgi:energy-coupling factor transporter ATP-binding protein EcfA2